MVDYKNGKVYKITSTETEDVYIGSTCATLNTRLINHRSAFKKFNHKVGSARNILKYADATIELIENCPCDNKRELFAREGVITKNTPHCVNIQIQGRTMAEYRIDNADKIKQQSVEYREKNKDSLQAKYKVWYNGEGGKTYREQRKAKINVKVPCTVCNKDYSKANLTRHMKIHAR
jgi:hypothetical protein